MDTTEYATANATDAKFRSKNIDNRKPRLQARTRGDQKGIDKYLLNAFDGVLMSRDGRKREKRRFCDEMQ